MAVDFRCEHCGKLLSVDAQPGGSVTCPHCQKQVAVPEALASLPRPQVPGQQAKNAAGSSGPPAPPAEGQSDEEQEEELEEESQVVGVMSTMMPWILSAFLHVAIFLIMSLFFIITMVDQEDEIKPMTVISDETYSVDPGGQVDPGEDNPDKEAAQEEETTSDAWARDESTLTSTAQPTDMEMQVDIGIGGGASGGGKLARKGLTSGGSGAGPKGKLFGHGGSAHHIVYVIDRSGSMAHGGVFKTVKVEMVRSISKLSPAQTFHIVLFGDGETIEKEPMKLVDATDSRKEEAVKFLQKHKAEGETDPIPALRRSFAVLGAADRKRRGKMIFLLTDGVFPDNDAVLKAIDRLNGGKVGDDKVHIFTYLYGDREREAIKVLQKIADENGGKFKLITGGR